MTTTVRDQSRDAVASSAEGGRPGGSVDTDGRSARCCFSRRRSTTSIARCSASSAPTLQHDLGWNEQQFADVVSWFTIAYALGFLVVGRIMDRVGTRRGFAGGGRRVEHLGDGARARATARRDSARRGSRSALGESGNFPASIKTVAEWFPGRERAFATGIFNAGSNIGAIVTPLVVPWIALTWGWRSGVHRRPARSDSSGSSPGCSCIAPPEEHPKCSPAELAYIRSDPIEKPTNRSMG